jgi:hypothetical protein
MKLSFGKLFHGRQDQNDFKNSIIMPSGLGTFLLAIIFRTCSNSSNLIGGHNLKFISGVIFHRAKSMIEANSLYSFGI